MSATTARPLVSIGVPVYNGARFLPQALDSLLAQTLRETEVIISDNASTDDTETICRAYATKDARIRYFRQAANIGAPANWNFVAARARGKYFKWSAANDYWAGDMLDKCVAVMEGEADVVLCHGKTCLVDDETGELQHYTGDIALMDALPHERFRKLYRTLGLNNAQSGLIRADVLRRTRLDRPYPGGDVVLMAELALRGRFVLLPEVLFYRRMGRATFSSLLTCAEIGTFFSPAAKRGVGLRCARLHLDFLVTVLTAPISLKEKLRAAGLVFRHVVWDRGRLWAELRQCFAGARQA